MSLGTAPTGAGVTPDARRWPPAGIDKVRT